MRRRACLWLALIVLLLGMASPVPAQEAPQRVKRDCQANLFCIEGLAFAGHAEIWLENLSDQVLTLALSLRASSDAEAQWRRLVLERPGRHKLIEVAVPRDSDWQVAWDYTYHPGRVPAQHDDSVTYHLPYASGEAHEVIQSYGGGFSHQGPLRFAVDWAMPVGTPVLAARDGVVIGFWEESDEGGPHPVRRGKENFLWIEHADGTVAHYLHLQQDGVLVARGERVSAGQVVALSGTTGYTTQPHLHFHVSSVALGKDALATFPVRFQTAGGVVIKPEVGRAYPAP
ncbi:MAG: M23 family metallopeptidase [Kiloniellales bacterium]